MKDRGEYVIAYTGYSSFGAGDCFAPTTDFQSINRFGRVLAPNNKDASVFPRKITGRY